MMHLEKSSGNRRDLVLALIYGLIIPLVVISLDGLQIKFFIGGILAMLCVFIIAPVRKKEETFLMMLGLVSCVKLEKNFFISYHFMKFNTTSAGFSFAFSDFLLMALYVCWFLRWIKDPQRIDRRILAYQFFYVLFLVLCLFSIVNADHSILTLYEFKKRLEAFFAILYLTANIRSVTVLKKFLVMVFSGVVVSSLVGVLQYVKGHNLGLSMFGETQDYLNQTVDGSSEIIHRVSGLMPHSNAFGMYLCLLLPIALSLSLSDIGKKYKYFVFAVFLLGCVGLTLTFSRGAISGFLAAIMIITVVKNRTIFQKHNHVILWISIPIMLGASFFIGEKVLNRFTLSPESNMSFRYMLNEAGFKMIEKHPFLGVGLNNFSTQLQFYDTHGVVANARFPAHNLYILIASETGVFALAFFLIFNAMVIACGINAYRTSEDIFVKNFCLGAVGGMIAVFLQSLVDFTFVVQVFYLLFFMICSLVIAARYNLVRPVL